MSGSWEEGKKRFKWGNETKKIYGEKFGEEFLAIRLLYPPLPSPSVRSVKCVAETYLSFVINGGLWRFVIFYYIWNCKNAFFAYSYIFFSVLIFTIYGNSVLSLVSVVDCHVASTVLVTECLLMFLFFYSITDWVFFLSPYLSQVSLCSDHVKA